MDASRECSAVDVYHLAPREVTNLKNIEKNRDTKHFFVDLITLKKKASLEDIKFTKITE